jgi:hypothetical protein
MDRFSVFRVIIYLYIPVDVLTTRWVQHHGLVPESWYQPLLIGRVLNLPAATATSMGLTVIALSILAPVAALGRGRRTIGPLVALLYFYWAFVAFTYGKVDHDRVALLTALAVMVTVDCRDRGESTAAGWALGMVQTSFMLTYFLAGITKLLVGGVGWITSTTLERAITRRGTMFADPLLDLPEVVLYVMQFLILAFELTSPLMLLRNRIARIYVGAAILFHLFSLVGITIYFRSHLICVIAFLPLERIAHFVRSRAPGRARLRSS